MTYDDLTQYEKHRFDAHGRCIYCGNKIRKDSNFKYVKTRYGRTVIYAFIHQGCIISARDWLKDHQEERRVN